MGAVWDPDQAVRDRPGRPGSIHPVYQNGDVPPPPDPEVKKEAIKARLVKPGLLEIEWPRAKGEEIPIE